MEERQLRICEGRCHCCIPPQVFHFFTKPHFRQFEAIVSRTDIDRLAKRNFSQAAVNQWPRLFRWEDMTARILLIIWFTTFVPAKENKPRGADYCLGDFRSEKSESPFPTTATAASAFSRWSPSHCGGISQSWSALYFVMAEKRGIKSPENCGSDRHCLH